MKYLKIVAVLFCFAGALPAQDEPTVHAAKIQAAISRLNAKNKNVDLVLKNLLDLRGKVVSSSDDGFNLRYKNKDGRRLRTSILYSNVLALKGDGELVSLIPVVTKKPHGNWEDIGKVFSGTKILVSLTDGRYIKGYSNSVNDTHLVLLDRETKERLDLPRHQVAAFVGFTLSRGGAKAGSKWAAKELHKAPILGVLGVGIGAIVGALTKVEGNAVLIYSR